MANWSLIKREYLRGKQPKELSEAYGVTAATISNKASEENWKLERIKKNEDIAARHEQKLEEITNSALVALSALLTSSDTSETGKNTAIRTAMDISGLKRDKKDIDITGDIEVIINHKSVSQPNKQD